MSTVEQVPLTKEGYEALHIELEKLKKIDRPHVIKDIAEARSHGDLKENAEYAAARERQGFVEGRIADLEDKLARAAVIDLTGQDISTVKFGAYVSVCEEESGEEKTYRIVGDVEADLERGRISINTPIARALMGKSIEDLVEVNAPKGKIEYTITDIKY